MSGNGIIKDPCVIEAMLTVDRGNFCKHNPYMDSPQGIGYAVTISAPHMVRFNMMHFNIIIIIVRSTCILNVSNQVD